MDGTSRHRRPANRSSPLLPLRYIKELNLSGSKVVVHTDQREISLTNLKVSSSKAGDSRERIRTYGFDYCFDSSNPETENYANQEKIYETLGKSVLDALFSGYNSCLVAYGQSASGKTYTMMGTKDDPGLTPRLCEGLLSRIDEEKKNERVFHVSVSYLEIYNERVRDLLKPSSSSSRLRVREHPRLGPYVQGLTHHAVQSLDALMSCVEEGARARKTASTLHNSSSSRSHALLTVALSAEDLESVCGSTLGSAGQRRRRRRPGASSTSVASLSNRQDAPPRAAAIKLHLVDLAGSESAATCGGLHRLKEGANINKSLVALGNVISALAERGSTGSGPGKRFIPYRDSSLTWLLKDALGGNATTIMLATISPASGSYNETANTLRFAQRAQSVVNKPMVNEDPVARIIRDLRAEVARLKTLLLEKDIEPQSRVPCCCEQNQRTIDSSRSKDKSSQAEIERTERRETEEKEEREEEDQEEEEEEKEEEEEEEEEQEEERSNPSSRKEGRNCTIGRFNSSESLQTCENGWTGAIRKFGSYEYLGRKDQLFGYNYNRAKVTELNEEEDEIVKEIEEPAFVDIPTLVAVLIKPEDASHETTVQIEEICSDEIAEDSIDRDASIDSNSANSSSRSSIIAIERRGDKTSRFHKQDSIDVAAPTNLRASKRFGSVEGLQKRRDVAPVGQLERSHTNLDRSRPSLTSSDGKIKKLNNIREIEDRKLEGSGFWRDLGKLTGKEQVQARPKNNSTRKPSLESLKRKTSKDSSSSSSKDEQILLSSLGASRRKDFIDQELSTRAHTPIQKVKRADIVAAVTERLYSSRKHTEQQEMASSLVSSDVRSPPEGTDMKSTTNVFAARSKLQEISRKMLAKRRRVCVDTQTDSARTVRVKDSASLTEKIDVVLRDVAVLTDEHEECLNRLRINEQRIPVLRVKETSTLTEKMKTVRYKDAESLADDLEFEADSKKPRKGASEFRSSKVESWTDTVALACTARDSTSQTRMEDLVEAKRTLRCERECCNLESSARSRNVNEKNVISISLPEIVSITIESANVLESNISVSDVVDERIKSKNMETQTEDKMNEKKEIEKTIVSACSRDSRSNVVGQTDGRGFRIENIFQDPMNASRMCSPASSIFDLTDSCPRRSLIFTNSLGTSFVPDTKESATEMEHARTHGVLVDRPCQVQEQSRVMTDAVVSKRYLFNDSWSTRVHGDGKEAESASLAFWKRSDSNGTSWSTDELLNASENNIATDATVETTTTSLSNDTEVKSPANVRETTNFKRTLLTFQQDSRKILERDYNFSDDSLDCNEENPIDLKSSCKMTGIEVARENICPPDVVAHTKKETPRSLAYAEKDDVQLDPMSDFEDSHVEFPRRKPCEMDACYSINDYKSLIMGTTSHEANEILFTEGATCLEGKASSRPGQARKKKVSFSTFSSVMGECEAQLKPPNLDKFDKTNLPKSIIKETKKTKSSRLNVASDDVDFSNDETNNFEESSREKNTSEASYEEDTNSAKAESESESFDYSQNSEDSSEVAGGKKVRFSKADVSEDACSDSESDVSGNEDGLTVKLKRNILEKYMNEAATFMRNINSINEYMTASNVMEMYMGRNVKRHEDSHKRCRHDRDYVEYKGRRIRLSDRDDDEVDDRNDITVPTESYQKCLEGIERLQNCIEQVDRHNEYLRERYGIIVESADAKSTLARSSTDSRRNEGDASRRDERGRLKAGGFSKIRSSSYRAAFEEAPKRVEEKKPEDEDHRRSDSSENFDDNFFDEPTSDLYRYWSVRRLRRKRCGKPPPAGKSKNLRSYLKIRERRETKGFSPEDKTEDEEEDEVEVEVENSQKFGGRSSVASPYESEMVALGRTRFHDVSDAGECAELPDNIASENSRDEFSRRIRSRRERFSSSRMESAADVDCLGSCGSFLACARPICGSVRSKNKLRYSGSPKAKFLELLRERRRIVESSRATSAS